MKIAGYTVTIKAFIPAPKDSFSAQARAASTMDELVTGCVITPAFVELALILDVSGKYGSAELPDVPLADIDPNDMAGGEGDVTVDPDAETPAEPEAAPAPRQKRGASQG